MSNLERCPDLEELLGLEEEEGFFSRSLSLSSFLLPSLVWDWDLQ